MKEKLIGFWKNEEGLGTLELLLILAVLVIIAIAFRKWIISWVNDLFKSTNKNMIETTPPVSIPS
ncbi:Flp1 family type IVb pilin [Gorillibacterium timonense]|uniref:Flp1 family type IVb pilin n=1 Tax=Gorillibacterium timonense TaxID=1689269 RepID=UPI0009ECA701|nr:Flp1 family type IVb pilin [Gorillibacterium timonense]